MQTLSSPLSGILGDRYDRVLVMSTGAFIWGVMTSAMALTVTLRQVHVWTRGGMGASELLGLGFFGRVGPTQGILVG